MHFVKDLYISESLKSKEKKLIRSIKYDKGFNKTFLVYRNNRNDGIEFMPSYFFRQKYMKKIPFEILGICDSYDDALNYLVNICCDKYNAILDTNEGNE